MFCIWLYSLIKKWRVCINRFRIHTHFNKEELRLILKDVLQITLVFIDSYIVYQYSFGLTSSRHLLYILSYLITSLPFLFISIAFISFIHCWVYFWTHGKLIPVSPFNLLFSRQVVSYSFVTPLDCSPPVSFVHRISQARILEQAAISSSRDLPNPRIKPTFPASPALAGRFFYHWATWEALF